MTLGPGADVRAGSIGDEVRALALEPPGGDPVYGAIAALRGPGVLQVEIERAWSRFDRSAGHLAHVAILQTHYKPYARGRLLCEVVLTSNEYRSTPIRQFLFLQVYSTSDAASGRMAASNRKRRLRCAGPPVFLMEAWNALAWSLPNGPRLRPARVCFSRKKFCRLLSKLGLGSKPFSPRTPELVRYVPRRRALFRYQPTDTSIPTMYIKVYSQGHDAVAAANLRQLAEIAKNLRFRVPALLAYAPRRRAVFLEELPGTQLTRVLVAPDPALFTALGYAVAGLHASKLEPGRAWSPQAEISKLRSAMLDIETALPAISPALAMLLDRIEEKRPHLGSEDRTPIHGNLFGDQILIGPDRQIGIVDWDDLRMGDPLHDVGRLIAHVIFVSRQVGGEPGDLAASMQAFLQAYEEATGQALARERLRWHVAVSLLERAKISALRPLSASWIDEVKNSVIDANGVLEGGGWGPAD